MNETIGPTQPRRGSELPLSRPISAPYLLRNNPLNKYAHSILNERGHADTAREIVRALAFDHRIEGILIMTSILSVECEDQAELRRCIEDEFRIVRDDPRALFASLTQKRNQLNADINTLRERDANETEAFQSQREQLALDLKKLLDKRQKKASQLDKYKRAHSDLRREFDIARSKLEDIASTVKDGTTSLTKIEGSVSVAQRKLDELAESHAEENGLTKAERAVAERQLADVSKGLEEAERRITLHAEDTAKHSERRPGPEGESPANGPVVTVSDLREFIGSLDSAPSVLPDK